MQMKAIGFILLVFLLIQNCSTPPEQPKGVLPIIILAGQSNMEGPADGTPVLKPYGKVLPNAKIYYDSNPTDDDYGEIESLEYEVNNNWRKDQLRTHGPELSLGYQLPLELGAQIGIIKYSLGGSRLVDDKETICKAGLWDVNGDAHRAGLFGLHFPILLNNIVKPAIDKYKEEGYTPKIAAFVWCQGEADATIEYCANHYEEKLTQLLNQFKEQLRGIDPGIDSMTVVISRIHNNFTPGKRPYLTEVRTALENVATNYPNAHWINTDTYPLMPDSTHWTKAGQIKHGLDISNVLKEALRSQK